METKNSANIKAIGKRLTQLRTIFRYSPQEFAEIAGVALATYKDWEYGKHGSIPERRAHQLLKTLWQEGVQCTLEWLLYGNGEPPQKQQQQLIFPDSGANNKPIGKAGEEKQIAAELNFFQAHNPDSMGFVVEDDSMLPNYAIGDVVAGIIISLKDIKKISGLNCLVQLNDGSVVLRNLQVVATDNQLALLCLNPDTKQQKVIYGIDPASVAPVVWHRQKRPLP